MFSRVSSLADGNLPRLRPSQENQGGPKGPTAPGHTQPPSPPYGGLGPARAQRRVNTREHRRTASADGQPSKVTSEPRGSHGAAVWGGGRLAEAGPTLDRGVRSWRESAVSPHLHRPVRVLNFKSSAADEHGGGEGRTPHKPCRRAVRVYRSFGSPGLCVCRSRAGRSLVYKLPETQPVKCFK